MIDSYIDMNLVIKRMENSTYPR